MKILRVERWGNSFRIVEFLSSPLGSERHPRPVPKVHNRPRYRDEGDYWEDVFEREESRFDSSIARARSRIRELALCNDWEYFVTLTLSPDKCDRFDLCAFVKRFGVWVGHYNNKYSCKLSYLMIPEKHPTSGAWHAHALFSGVSPASLVTNEHGYCDMPYYRNSFGFISLDKIRNKERCSSYISKYVSKEMVETSYELGKYKHLYYSSRGLARREVVGQGTIENWKSDWYNEFVGISYVDENTACEVLTKLH